MRGRHAGISIAFGALLIAAPVTAQERGLNERHPVRLADAFPVGRGDVALLTAGMAIMPRDGPTRATFPLDVQYGVLSDVQLSLSTQSATTAIGDPASGDLTLAGRASFSTESTLLPFFAIQLGATAPSGDGSRATDLELKGYASREVRVGNLQLFLHLNASVDVRATHLGGDERRLVYHLATGPSFTVPQHATTTLVADVFVDQARKRGDSETIGVELGLRQRLTSWLVFDAGVGTEAVGPGDRAAIFATIGLSVTFATAGR